MNDLALQRLGDELASKSKLLIISGAGISTDSGIGDYRDEDGEWKLSRPVMHQDFISDAAWRQRYWARSMHGYPQFSRAEPNVAHQCLARWEKDGRVLGVITQNVDRLHQRAGSRQVIDLHGRLDHVRCMSCHKTRERQQVQSWLEQHNAHVMQADFAPTADGDAELALSSFADVRVPECECGGMLKPDVVFYGDSVPRAIVDLAYHWVDQADAVLVVGSSLAVFSSFRFVRKADQLGIPVYAINRGKTRADALYHIKVEMGCADALAALT